jgi:uncharacterized protein
MGPTNVALVKLFQADQKLREAQGRLDATTKNVRIQERRVRDLNDKITATQARLKEQQAHAHNMDLDLKSRDAHIEKLRTQQQQAKNNKEYQAFLVEINTGKVDRNKVEEEAIKELESIERMQAELKDLQAQLEGENAKLGTMRGEITQRTASIQAEIDEIKPEREAAAQAVPPKARVAFDRLADRFEGEAMSPLIKPDKRREEYSCSACMMDLVRDVYNKLHVRDELVFCPSCQRILYIPEDLPVEAAVHKPKERKERAGKAPGAGTNRQTSAVDVLRSIQVEEDEDETVAQQPDAPPAGSPEAEHAAETTPPLPQQQPPEPAQQSQPQQPDAPPPPPRQH